MDHVPMIPDVGSLEGKEPHDFLGYEHQLTESMDQSWNPHSRELKSLSADEKD